MNNGETLLISEIFHSIQGESSFAGWPCAFIRLSGCGHGCLSCDTAYAESGGVLMALEEIIDKAIACEAPCIEITGGEPLLQPAVYPLMHRLCDLGQLVLLETGGFLPVDKVDHRVHKIVDVKPPSSGVCNANCMEIISFAAGSDTAARKTFEFKFVLADREDYNWAKTFIFKHELTRFCTVIFGAVYGRLDPRLLAGWILADRLQLRMQLQLHKYIWPADMTGV
jgi:7-carboxy-7-deazaguanine synthase